MEDVDRILRPFAIGFTPYAVNSGLTLYINPDKYYLHLNAGIEVISTPIPQAVRMKRLIHIGDSATRIVSLMRALQANKTFRRNIAPTEKTTWRFKAAELTDLIQKKFASGNWR